jgi:ABC-type uncharacterized transport system auxiliary subunit
VSPTPPLAAAALALLLATGCALTQKARPLEVTYYTPEHPSSPGVASPQPASGPELRLERVESGTDLGERIVFGDGAYRIGYYDSRRWTERPEIYARRSLTRILFEERGFRRAMSGDAPTLDVEILTFQEIRTPAQHEARVVLRLVLSTDRVLLEDTIAAAQPVVGDTFDDVVAAMSRALEQSSSQVARRVGSALDSSAPEL